MQALVTVLRQDPLLTYSVAAALVLLAAALTAGFSRLDFVAVFHPHGLLAVVSAVLTSLVLMVFIAWLERNLMRVPWLWLDTLPESAFPLVGAWRLPLYVIALAYGPSAGLLAAALIAAFSASTGLPGWQEGLLAFELITVGWLAIAPNPREHAWAGTFNVLLAHLLTLTTLGLALLRWQQRPLTLTELWQLSGNVSGGVLLGALVVAYVTPAFYARVFATSRIVPPAERTPHMPLPPLTALAQTKSLLTPPSSPNMSPQATKPQATKPQATKPQATKPQATKPKTTASPLATDDGEDHPYVNGSDPTSDTKDTAHSTTLTTLPTTPTMRSTSSKRPSERQLSMPAFFEVDDSDSFETNSFEPNDLERDSLETAGLEAELKPDNLKANKK